MTERLQFLEASDTERRRFGNLASLLELRSTDPVLPANRLRVVHSIEVDGRRYFLKQFQRTQWKNQWRNLTTAPRCRLDADREAAMSASLRAAGLQAPRPVVTAQSGASSYYLCAELPGESLRRRLAMRPIGRREADQVAAFCGSLFRQGFQLPDLSADHVFVDSAGDPARPQFGVLDLHNGTRTSPDRVSTRALRRSLRRFRRSVRDLDLPDRSVLRFAIRMLLATGIGRAGRRAVLGSFPTIDTAARYSHGRPANYARRNPERDRAELGLLAKVWPGRAGDKVLDLPCGAGRLGDFVESREQFWIGADRSLGMVELASETGSRVTLVSDAAEIPLADRSVAGVVAFRFLHHCPTAMRRSVLDELTRVADRFVVVSSFHPISTHNLERGLRSLFAGRSKTRFPISGSRLRQEMAARGFGEWRRAAQAPYLRDLWVTAFVRTDDRPAGRSPAGTR